MVVGWRDLRRRRKKDENGKYFITVKRCVLSFTEQKEDFNVG